MNIIPRSQTVRVGESVELRCEALGVPQPIVLWSNPRGSLFGPHIRVEGGILRISSVDRGDAGEYVCTARNTLGSETQRAVLHVQGGDDYSLPEVIPPAFGLVVTINPNSYEARPGETVRFRCDVSERGAQIQWAKSSGVLPLSASESPDGTLTLNSVRDTDSGIYVCTAVSNSGQSAQGQARLQVSFLSAPPSARIEPERQTVAQGSVIEIRCIATGNPTPTIEWSKVGGQLPSAASVSH